MMQITKEAVTVVMSPYERDDILKHLGVAIDFLDDAVKAAGDVETGSTMVKVMDAQAAIYDLYRKLESPKFA